MNSHLQILSNVLLGIGGIPSATTMVCALVTEPRLAKILSVAGRLGSRDLSSPSGPLVSVCQPPLQKEVTD